MSNNEDHVHDKNEFIEQIAWGKVRVRGYGYKQGSGTGALEVLMSWIVGVTRLGPTARGRKMIRGYGMAGRRCGGGQLVF